MALVSITTAPCIFCEKFYIVKNVNLEGYLKFLDGEAIDKALPELSKEDRELLLTGIDQECWDDHMKDPEE